MFNYFTQYDQEKLEKGIFAQNNDDVATQIVCSGYIFLPNKKFVNIHQINSFIKKKNINNI